ncbi:MAG: hypothetical protein ACOH13_14145 [Flavobacteriales bacterium]
MEPKKPSDLTDQELLQQSKIFKRNKIASAVFIGMLAGIASYSIVNNGLNFLPFTLLFFILAAVKKGATDKALEQAAQHELSSRGIQ